MPYFEMPSKYLTMLLLLLKMLHSDNASNCLEIHQNAFKLFKLPQDTFKCLHICGILKFSYKSPGIEIMINLDEIYPCN